LDDLMTGSAEPMSHPSDFAEFLHSRQSEVLADWVAAVQSLPRRRKSDFRMTRDGMAELLSRIVANLQSSGRDDVTEAASRTEALGLSAATDRQNPDESALLRRAILRVAQRDAQEVSPRELRALEEAIDVTVGIRGEAVLSAEHAARLEAEAASTKARDAKARCSAAAQRQRFIADASRMLAESMDYQATLMMIARLAVPDLADWCVVDLIQDDGRMARVAIEHKDPSRLRLAHALQENFPPRSDATVGPAHVVRTGQTEFEAQISDSSIQAIAPETERRRLLAGLGVNSYISVALNTRGRTLGTITFFTDTGRTLSSDDVAMAEDLARRAATAIDNVRLYDQAQRAIRVRDDILAIVSHDLRTPLSAIVTAAALQIAAAPPDENGGRIRQRAATIQRAAQHMSRLIRDLTDIGRIDAGQFAIERKPQDLPVLVRQVVDTLQPIATRQGSRLRADAVGIIPQIECDGDRIVQVISNLVGNAIKVGAPSVIVRVEARTDEVLFTVSDTGPGIRQEDLPHMFDRYWRGATANYKGTGLGLPIAKAIVSAHGGRIWIESEVGVGSRFFFALPC
jgi:signal transduction histidine kinase